MSIIQAIRTGKTQTLLHVDATYNQVVTALGQPDTGRETDKSWHGWKTTALGGEVEVYDYARHLGSERRPASRTRSSPWGVAQCIGRWGDGLDADHLGTLAARGLVLLPGSIRRTGSRSRVRVDSLVKARACPRRQGTSARHPRS